MFWNIFNADYDNLIFVSFFRSYMLEEKEQTSHLTEENVLTIKDLASLFVDGWTANAFMILTLYFLNFPKLEYMYVLITLKKHWFGIVGTKCIFIKMKNRSTYIIFLRRSKVKISRSLSRIIYKKTFLLKKINYFLFYKTLIAIFEDTR